MDITFDKKSKVDGVIKVSLKEEDYKPKVKLKLKEYGKKISLKGFRPGKVPAGLVNKMHGKSILAEEINGILSESLRSYIEENDIQTLGDPLPVDNGEIDWDTQKDFEFEYELGLVDAFEVDLKAIKVTDYQIEVNKKEIDEVIDENRDRLGEMAEVDAIDKADYVTFQVTDVDGEIEESLYLGLDQMVEASAKKFLKKKVGDKINLDIKKAFEDQNMIKGRLKIEDESYEKLSKKTAFEITKIERSGKADLNQDFFDKLFGKDEVKSEKELEDKISDNLKDRFATEGDQFKNFELRTQLLANTKIELPESFLKKWLVASNQNEVTAEQVEKEFDAYSESIRWNLITDSLVKQFTIEVASEEVKDEGFKQLTKQFGGMPMTEDMKERMMPYVDDYLKQDQGRNYMQAYNQVKITKVFSTLSSEIKAKKKKLDWDAFKKLVEKAN